MTKKDYELIAARMDGSRATSGLNRETWNKALDYAARSLADALGQQDRTFKRAQFLADCGASDA